MFYVIYEGTPDGTIPVQALNGATPIYWEAGAFGMLDSNGKGLVSDGTKVFGLLADRRNVTVAPSIINFLPTISNDYGDESLFNQPGHGNSMYGTQTNQVGTSGSFVNETANSVIPGNAMPTTGLKQDETAVNPNAQSRLVTMYTRGGEYGTDQFDGTKTYAPGDTLYIMQDGSGRVTNSTVGLTGPITVGVVKKANNGYGFLEFKMTVM